MLLTIGMIVRNEEKHLRRCLEGIKPILERVSSELIIIDTGSTDKTIEIAREFTNKVYEVEWRNDFAWARNQVLDYARGRWLFSLDADEIFQDCEDIIEFFNSGEFRENNFATIVLKNLDAKGDVINFVELPRLYKLGKNTRWTGKIHEVIHTALPGKNLKSYCLHDGYVLETKAQKMAKHKRNIGPLLEEYEKQPNDPRTIIHLINEYQMASNKKEWKKYIDIGLGLNLDKSNSFYRAFVSHLVVYHSAHNEHEELVDVLNKYFKESTVPCVSDITKYTTKLQSEMKLKRYDDAALSGINCYKSLEKQEAGQLNTDVQLLMVMPIEGTLNKSNVSASTSIAFALAGEYAQAIEWMKKAGGDKHSGIFNSFVAEAIREEMFDKITGMYTYVFSNFGNDCLEYEYMVSAIERCTTGANVKNTIAKAFLEHSIGNADDDFMRLQELRTTGTGLQHFLGANRPFPQYFGDAAVAAIRTNADFSAFLARLEITNSAEFIANLIRTNNDLEELVLANCKKWLDGALPLKSLRILSMLAASLYGITEVKKQAEDEKDKNLEMFEMSARLRHQYLQMIYRNDVYCEEHIADLSEDDGFVFYVGRAYDCKDTGDIAEFARSLRMALRIKPKMKNVITMITDRLQQEMEQPPVSVHDELAELKAAVKGMIQSFIATGDFASASAALEMYAADNADDPDVKTLREAINAKLPVVG